MIQLSTVLSASLLAMWDLDYCLGKQTDNYFASEFTDFQCSQKKMVSHKTKSFCCEAAQRSNITLLVLTFSICRLSGQMLCLNQQNPILHLIQHILDFKKILF